MSQRNNDINQMFNRASKEITGLIKEVSVDLEIRGIQLRFDGALKRQAALLQKGTLKHLPPEAVLQHRNFLKEILRLNAEGRLGAEQLLHAAQRIEAYNEKLLLAKERKSRV